MERKVIDNFLPQDVFEYISEIVMTPKHDRQILWQHQATVAEFDDGEKSMPHWNWMGISMIYSEDEVMHPFYEELKDSVLPVIREKAYNYRALSRIKVNFYPWTHEIKHHRWHTDFSFDNVGAVWSMNTCDGYTEFEDGQIVESVANRLVVFNAQDSHRSTTTTTNHGRYNINFNLV